MRSNVILVPTDFTKAAETASAHAGVLGSVYQSKIVFLHIVSKASEVDENKKMLDQFIAKVSAKYQINHAEGIVRIGNIFEDIGDVALELGAHFIVMGTHGVKGIQKITGSRALKVITNSEIPIIVVQEKEAISLSYKNIVLPLDLSKETRQKIGYAAEIARKFNSTIHILYPLETDEYLRKQSLNNVLFAKKYFHDHQVSFKIHEIEDGSFVKDAIRYASSIEADLIAIMNISDGGLPLISSDPRQQMLTNDALIPVLCVNPRETMVGHWK